MPDTSLRPAVSVLLPVYNGGAFFRQAVDSILSQSFADFELLILDDGSKDDSGEVAEGFARQDARVRVIRRDNRGLVVTLNELLAEARADIVARMDADDVAFADRFQRQIDFLAAHPEVVCVGGGQLLIDEADRRICAIHALPDDTQIQQQALRGHGSICHPTVMIRTAAMRAIGGYRANYYPAEDLDVWLRLGELGQLANLPDPVICYRIHSGSISGQAAQGRQRDAMRRACADACQRRGISDIAFEAGAPWRPGEDRASRAQFAIQYGWMAYQSGYARSALAYGVKAIRAAPLASGGWRLLLTALLKPCLAKG